MLKDDISWSLMHTHDKLLKAINSHQNANTDKALFNRKCLYMGIKNEKVSVPKCQIISQHLTETSLWFCEALALLKETMLHESQVENILGCGYSAINKFNLQILELRWQLKSIISYIFRIFCTKTFQWQSKIDSHYVNQTLTSQSFITYFGSF